MQTAMEKLPTRVTHVIAAMAIAARGIPVYADPCFAVRTDTDAEHLRNFTGIALA